MSSRDAVGALAPTPPGAGDGMYGQLTAAINAQVALLYQVSVELVQFPSQGDFAWWYLSPNQVFNAATFDYVSARVMPSPTPGLVQLTLSGGYPLAYAELLDRMTFAVSTADAGSAAAQAQAAHGLWVLDQLRAATREPTATNGGMQTVDPVAGSVSAAFQVGYGVAVSIAALQGSLGGAGATIVVTIAGPSGSTVSLTYTGCTMVPVAPAAWQPATAVGWYWADPVAQAFAQSGRDVTGYVFTSPPPYHAGPVASGGDLGRIVSLLVSDRPTVAVVPSRALTLASVPAVVDVVAAELALVGLTEHDVQVVRPGRSREVPRAPGAVASAGGSGPPTPLTASAPLAGPAPPLAPSVPVLQQRAYVIGVSVDVPAA